MRHVEASGAQPKAARAGLCNQHATWKLLLGKARHPCRASDLCAPPALELRPSPGCPYAGLLGFYKGMRAKIVQSILAAALLMAIKEQLTTATAAVLDPKVVVVSVPTKQTVRDLAELHAIKAVQ